MGQGGRIQYQRPRGRTSWSRERRVLQRQGDWASGTEQGSSSGSNQNLGIPRSSDSPSGSEEEWKEHGFGVSVLSQANCGQFPPMYSGDDDVCVTDVAEWDLSTSRWWCW